ncbi:MAG: Ig-like domain-containing protein [Bacteroidales bacterium]
MKKIEPLSKKLKHLLLLLCVFCFGSVSFATVFTISPSTSCNIYPTTLGVVPTGGDTIKILSTRTLGLKFHNIVGSASAPIVIINSGGRVMIDDTLFWGAISFLDCRYIKVTGAGDASVHFGFSLRGATSGLAFVGLSSDCEAEFIEIQNSGFFGIVAKKDFNGTPPQPLPQFTNLIIHDNYIHDVGEGMYIGETKSPGMEFRHVRIYNNVVTNCEREAIQVANCVEDIEAYNNFCSTTGLIGLYGQEGSFQIGDNTVGRFYNNIFMNCPGLGVPVFGSGDIEVFNNYISNTKGVFIDERKFSVLPSSISIMGNHFYNTMATPVTNLNGVNEMHIKNNIYNTNGIFAKNNNSSVPVWDVSGNQLLQIDSLGFSVFDGIFSPFASNPDTYNGIGPQTGLTHTMNSLPVFNQVDDQYVLFGDSLNLTITATTTDNDKLFFEVRNLPSCIVWQNSANGQIVLKGFSSTATKGVYSLIILVHDSSNNAYSRLKIKIAFKDPANSAPVFALNGSYSVEATTKLLLDVTATDANNDALEYSFLDLPGFINSSITNNHTLLQLKPLLSDKGSYSFMVVADDGYGNPDTANISVIVSDAVLVPGKVIYRINNGGPEIEDEPMNWQPDLSREPVYGIDMAYGTGSHSWSGSNNTGVPNPIFGPYRHCAFDSVFRFHFEVPTNGKYEVSLLFAERPTEVTNNKTETFNVKLEDSLVLGYYNIYNKYAYSAVREVFVADVSDQAIDIEFQSKINDAKINGFEIKFLEASNNPPLISGIGNISINEGTTDTLYFSVLDDQFPGCDTLIVSLENAPWFLQLQKIGTNFCLIIHPGYTDSGIYQAIVLHATDNCTEANQNFTVTVNEIFLNHVPILSELAAFTITEAQTANYLFSATDADNQTLTFTFVNLPTFAQFVQTANGFGKLIFNPGYNDSGVYPIVITVHDTYQATDSDTLILTVLNSQVIARIPLNASMITDLVRPPYGSWTSAAYLVDEQILDPTLNQHAVSASWKPFYNMNFAPYHIYFDLGQEYVIKKVYLHDMNSVANLDFSYGVPENWTPWFTEPCNNYNNWKLHQTDVTTRYIRLSMYSSVYAAINELAIYGYPTGLKGSEIVENPNNDGIVSHKVEDKIKIWPNPATTKLTVTGMSENASVNIYNMTGQIVSKSIYSEMNVSNLAPAIYQLVVVGENGETEFSSRLVIK